MPSSEVQSPEKEKPSKSGGETVLVVEDNLDVCELTLQRLKRLGYKTIVANSGSAAIAALGNDNNIDLVFTDVVMAGGMSGVDVAQWVRTNRPRAKILLTSGYAELADDDAFAELGIKILRKPYKLADLGRAIEEALQAEGRSREG